jgi:DNA modification methylase
LILNNGSGTTAIAFKNTNRHYIGYEKDEKYFNIINERILELSKIKTNKT